jgi:hypothetical protein
VSLEEFLQGWEEVFPYAKTDVLDKWKVKFLSPETFAHYIDLEKISVPGNFSAASIAAVDSYDGTRTALVASAVIKIAAFLYSTPRQSIVLGLSR